MKALVLFLIMISSSFVFAQNNETEVHPNNIRTRMHSTGQMFWDLNNARFQVPYIDSNSPSAIFAGGLWMGGLDPAGNVKVVAQTFDRPAQGDYTFGLTDIMTPDFDFDKVWRVKRTEIQAHIEDFADGNIDNPVAEGILSWPASGNSGLENIEASFLAAFVDIDGDNIYDPMSGDHPAVMIGGEAVIPDDMIFTIYHSRNQGGPAMDVHSTLYGFEGTADDVVAHSLFMQQKIISRENEDLRDFRFSYWIDADLGCYTDDYIGCDPSRNAMITYNADDEDGDNGICLVPTYEDPPVISLTLLNQPMSFFSYSNNAGVGGPPSGTIDPSNDIEEYNLMGAIWRDGTPLTNGGNGYNPMNDIPVTHAFPGDPTIDTEWSMLSENLPLLDPRTLTTNQQDVLQPGQFITYDAVINFTNCPGHLTDIAKAKENIDHLQDLYDRNFEGVSNTSDANNLITEVILFPNPSTGKIQIESSHDFETYIVTDLQGRRLAQGEMDNTNELNLDLFGGSYLLKMYEREGGVYYGKVVIQRW